MTQLHSQNRATTEAANHFSEKTREKHHDLTQTKKLAEKRLKEIEKLKIQLARTENNLEALKVKMEQKGNTEQHLNQSLNSSRVSQTKTEIESRTLKALITNYEI